MVLRGFSCPSRFIRLMPKPRLGDSSPEKAGVGGSIPSLATTKSVTYGPSRTRFHSNSFQNTWPAGMRPAGEAPFWNRSVARPLHSLASEFRHTWPRRSLFSRSSREELLRGPFLSMNFTALPGGMVCGNAGFRKQGRRREGRHPLPTATARSGSGPQRRFGGPRQTMQHIPDGSLVRVHIGQTHHGGPVGTVEDCISCQLRVSNNLLFRCVDLLRKSALRKRPTCSAAGKCGQTGLPVSANEPPHVDDCKCFLTRE